MRSKRKAQKTTISEQVVQITEYKEVQIGSKYFVKKKVKVDEGLDRGEKF